MENELVTTGAGVFFASLVQVLGFSDVAVVAAAAFTGIVITHYYVTND
jgi:hypothetical protein